MKFSGKHRITSFQTIAIGFILLILAGTALLMIPGAAKTSVSFMDCLFTAVSAVCVTGLVVLDTASSWSPLGQGIILLLIQIGGMGVVTAALTLSFISGRRIGLKQRSLMQESISAPQVGGIVRLTRFIVFTTFCIELVGALLLVPSFVPEFGWERGLWYALFHAVSAFCNAGFDLMGVRGSFSSMTTFEQNIPVNLVLMLLIIIGGIGFLVWNDIREHGFRFRQHRLQTKIVLLTSGILILLGALWLFSFELEDLAPGQRILPAFFQSVTLRTAGFNTVDLNRISGGGQSLMILWMLIGGSPGSTAGGVKTTTVAVLLLTAVSVFRQRHDVDCFGRRIADSVLRNAVTLLVMYILLFFTGGVLISRLENLPLLSCLFESASALGTVGLSLGITGQLGTASRIILILLMFSGRVGGLTLIYAAHTLRPSSGSTRPLEKVTVG